jgi:S-adenosylmethionine:tRNA ribosyltransferase-isomerase
MSMLTYHTDEMMKRRKGRKGFLFRFPGTIPTMRLADFDYSLPPDLIAQRPLEHRDQSRLMVVERGTGKISHHVFRELPSLLTPRDLLVLNNTKVFPARLLGRRLGVTAKIARKHPPASLPAQIEVLLLRPLGNDEWEVLVRPGRKMRLGERAFFGRGELECEVIGWGERGLRRVRFIYQGSFEEWVDQLGHIPLPPYIHRGDDPSDLVQYQTLFACKRGAVAAPTAGLHFTARVFKDLKIRGVDQCEITLHVGLGTFQPVEAENIENHQMHHEWYEISPEAANKINATHAAGDRVFAVGTTAARTLETVARQTAGSMVPSSGETNLFIYPGFPFRAVDGLLTNFHLPQSTLLMLVSAFAGRELILEAYRQAIENRYRFYSYGDCMLIL